MKLRIFYELDGHPRWEEFEPIVHAFRRGVVVDYNRMEERAYNYADALMGVGARKVSVIWDGL